VTAVQQQNRGRYVALSAVTGLLVMVLAACAGAPVRPVPGESPAVPVLEVGPQVGQQAPEIIGRDVITKEPVALSSLAGQVVVLNFWATWCKPCEEEMPDLEIFHHESAGKARVIAVGADARESPEKMAEFVKQMNLTFSVVNDQGAGAERYRIIGLPTSFFIDRKGIVRTKHQGQMSLSQIQRWAADAEEKGRN